MEVLFRSFDWQPHAAASIGQVHRAGLLDGTPVAVKVQILLDRELIRADLRLMRWLATLIDLTPLFGRTRARAVVQEFARWTEEELDYRIQARHAQSFDATLTVIRWNGIRASIPSTQLPAS